MCLLKMRVWTVKILQMVLYVSATFHMVSCFLPLRVYTPWWDRLYLLSFSLVSLVSPTWQLLLWILSSLQQALYISSLFTPLPQVLSKCFQTNESIIHSLLQWYWENQASWFSIYSKVFNMTFTPTIKKQIGKNLRLPKESTFLLWHQYNSKCYLMLCLMESRLPWWLRQ